MLNRVWHREHRLSSPANEVSSAELRAMAAWPRGAVDTSSPCHAEAPLCSTSQPLVLFSRRLKEITDGPRLSKATVAPLAEMKLPLLSSAAIKVCRHDMGRVRLPGTDFDGASPRRRTNVMARSFPRSRVP